MRVSPSSAGAAAAAASGVEDDAFTARDAFDEVVVGGAEKVYAVAEPGEEYAVRVNVYRDMHGEFTPPRLRVGLYVDGVDVNYWKRIDLSCTNLLPRDTTSPVSATFWGFKKNANDIRSFVFATPTVINEVGQLPALGTGYNEKALGSIKVVVFPAQVP